jgi:hypothetical protein
LFVSNTLPCIHDNTIILAATHPNLTTANPKYNGWFVSDFYAFNILLKGLRESQTWLTAADPEKLVQRYHNFLGCFSIYFLELYSKLISLLAEPEY